MELQGTRPGSAPSYSSSPSKEERSTQQSGDPYTSRGSAAEKKMAGFWNRPLSLSTNVIVPFDETDWKEQICNGLKRTVKQYKADILIGFLSDFIENGILFTPIHSNLSLAQKKDYKKYLDPFLTIDSPKRFVKCMATLITEEEKTVFYSSIGGEEVIDFLSSFFYESTTLPDYFEKYKKDEGIRTLVQSKTVEFKQGFDSENPISSVSNQEIVASFHSLPDKSIIMVNQQPFSIHSQTDKSEGLVPIFEKLIDTLEKGFNIKPSKNYPSTTKAELLCETKINKETGLKLTKSIIPCFRVLQALSAPAFNTAEQYFQKNCVPQFFHDDQDSLRLIQSTEPTRYEITAEGHNFTVNHIKTYEFVEKDEEVIGNIKVFWKLFGTLDTRSFTASFRYGDLDFFNADSSIHKKIVTLMCS